jgi:hypothetical protein
MDNRFGAVMVMRADCPDRAGEQGSRSAADFPLRNRLAAHPEECASFLKDFRRQLRTSFARDAGAIDEELAKRVPRDLFQRICHDFAHRGRTAKSARALSLAVRTHAEPHHNLCCHFIWMVGEPAGVLKALCRGPAAIDHQLGTGHE